MLENQNLRELRIAVLGGVTTNEVVSFLELLLLSADFRPVFHQSEYNRYFEDAVVEPERLLEFKPELIIIYTHGVNVRQKLPVSATLEDLRAAVEAERERHLAMWNSLHTVVGCHVIQNNCETPRLAFLGNSECSSYGGQVRFTWELNLALSQASSGNRKLSIHDMNSLATSLGHARWYDDTRWYSSKIPVTPEANFAIARSLAAMIGAIFGKSRKCLVLDLDNTLWGGVIGDDGPDKIQIGRETAVAEAYTAFQEYCLELRRRGILLAVCSKNNIETARSGFLHPASVLRLEHFSAFKANWEPKDKSIREIARDLNLGLDSFVFVDDNPAERALVRAQLPMVLTPEVGNDITAYASILQATRCFEAVGLSEEDLSRADAYTANAARAELGSKFSDYGAYLDSLRMEAEIDVFVPVYLDRITQLINKTNQFNLTTRRYTFAEVEAISRDPAYIALYCKLTDAFGENGLISLIIGRQEEQALHLDLWLMSCRVLKRDVEFALLDELVERARDRGLIRIVGYYRKTAKNAMVRDHFRNMRFQCESSNAEGDSSEWILDVRTYEPQNRHIALAGRAATANL